MTVNEQQIADWNGVNGARWVHNQERLDAMLAPFGTAALHAAAPTAGEHVLDIGCGAGQTTLAIDRIVGNDGRTVGLDVSEPLILRARERADAGGVAARFLLADASRAPVDPEGYDVLFSRFGVMFFDDPAAAFAHLRRGLKPDGRIAFICWRTTAENDWHHLPISAIRDIVPLAPPPGPDAPSPFSFGDPRRITHILSTAGFADIAIQPFDRPIPFGHGATIEAAIEDAIDQSFRIGPLSRALADQPDSVKEQATQAVRTAFARRADGPHVIINGAAWIVTARNRAD